MISWSSSESCVISRTCRGESAIAWSRTTGTGAPVEQALDAWNVARERNTSTGDVTHLPLVYVLDANGRIPYASSGGVAAILELLSRN